MADFADQVRKMLYSIAMPQCKCVCNHRLLSRLSYNALEPLCSVRGLPDLWMMQPRLLASEGTLRFISSPVAQAQVGHCSGDRVLLPFLCDPFSATASGILAGKTRMGYEIRRLVHSNKELENQQASGNMLWKSGIDLAPCLPICSSYGCHMQVC